MNLVVLISGNGSNLQAIIDACKSGDIPGHLRAVISNKPDVFGLERARLANIPTEVIPSQGYTNRSDYDQVLMQSIDRYQPDLVILAGFMRILTPGFVQHYAARLLNIHPSLLPKYPGLHTHQQALNHGDQEHGATVHFVTEELDGGPLIVQGVVPVHRDDDEVSLSHRVHTIEHQIYPLAIRWFCQQTLFLKDGAVWLNSKQLPAQGIRLTTTDRLTD